MNYIQYINNNIYFGLSLIFENLPNFIALLTKLGRYQLLGPFYRLFSPTSPKTFIIICQARTGSHFLVFLLASHLQIRLMTEPFGIYDLSKNWILQRVHKQGLLNYVKQQLAPQADERLVGLKILYHQLEQEHGQNWGIADELPDILDFLKQNRDFKIIHLKRRNRFRRLVSAKIVEQNQVYILFNRRRRDNQIQVELTPAEVVEGFNHTVIREMMYDQFFAEHALLELFYEDLTTNTVEEGKRVLDFLGVAYQPLRVSTVKQNVRPLREMVKNYEALKQHFAGTQWAEFFDE